MAKKNRASVQEALRLAAGSEEDVEPVVDEVSSLQEALPVSSVSAPQAVVEASGASNDEGHRKTSTGYVRATGEKMIRLTLHMTPSQKRALKTKALQAGYDSPSAFILDRLGLSDA